MIDTTKRSKKVDEDNEEDSLKEYIEKSDSRVKKFGIEPTVVSYLSNMSLIRTLHTYLQ